MNLKKPILLLLLLAACASSAFADPVLISNGTIIYSRTQSGSFTLSGSGMAVNGLTAPLSSSVSLLSNGVILPGGSGSTGGSIDTQDSELLIALPITAEGVSHTPGASLLVLQFSSSSFTAPIGLFPGFVVVAPFTLTAGLLEGYPSSLGDVPLFSVPLTGQGITTLTFLSQPGGVYRLESQSFVFGTTVQGVTVQSIPEPASVLLLLTSFAGLARFRRKRS
jgi:hypothetical protein